VRRLPGDGRVAVADLGGDGLTPLAAARSCASSATYFNTTPGLLFIDEFGAVSAEPKRSVFDSPEFKKWAEKRPLSESFEPEEQYESNSLVEEEKLNISPNNVNFEALINELDEMDGTSKKKFESSSNSTNQATDHMKSCLNKDCLYCLPKEAKFCLKCGTAQMPKFCTECGFSFPSMEKFCPDCGKKR
jgi:hypothetical protein